MATNTCIEQLESKYDIPSPYRDGHPAVEEAEDIDVNIEPEQEDRFDLRDLQTFTIDPEDAKDYDDAISVHAEEEGYRVWVHIADVAHYVEEETHIDTAAKERGVTFYLDDDTRHMLPEELASDICSLEEGKDRLAHTVEMELNENVNGEYQIDDFNIYESIVNVDTGLSYTEADDILTDNETSETPYPILERADDLTQEIRDDRWEYSLIINDESSPSSRIVEELMLKANQAVARHLIDEGKAGIFRIEEYPNPDWTENIEENINEEGYSKTRGWLSESEKPKKTLNDFVKEEVQEDDQEKVIQAIVTEIKPAEYSTWDDKHFALDFDKYAHFTSPIRRVADLVNHRQVKQSPPEANEELLQRIEEIQSTVATLNKRSRDADRAEREYNA